MRYLLGTLGLLALAAAAAVADGADPASAALGRGEPAWQEEEGPVEGRRALATTASPHATGATAAAAAAAAAGPAAATGATGGAAASVKHSAARHPATPALSKPTAQPAQPAVVPAPPATKKPAPPAMHPATAEKPAPAAPPPHKDANQHKPAAKGTSLPPQDAVDATAGGAGAACDFAGGFGLVDGACARLCRSNSCGCSNEVAGTPLTHILSCAPSGQCSVDNATNKIVCACRGGWAGDTCNRCAVGFTGYPACAAQKECAAGPCQHGGRCDGATGTCTCPASATGPACATCASGFQPAGSGGALRCVPVNAGSGAVLFWCLAVLAGGVLIALVGVLYRRRVLARGGGGRAGRGGGGGAFGGGGRGFGNLGRGGTRRHGGYLGIPTDDLDAWDDDDYADDDEEYNVSLPAISYSRSPVMDDGEDVLIDLPHDDDEEDLDDLGDNFGFEMGGSDDDGDGFGIDGLSNDSLLQGISDTPLDDAGGTGFEGW